MTQILEQLVADSPEHVVLIIEALSRICHDRREIEEKLCSQLDKDSPAYVIHYHLFESWAGLSIRLRLGAEHLKGVPGE